MRFLYPVAAIAGLGAIALGWPAEAPARTELTPAPALVLPSQGPREIAYFAGGCFWGVEAVFDRVRGVESAVSGYTGGRAAKPTYAPITSGTTGHAETVRVTFDPRQVRYADLLRIYFSVIADPTQLNRQGPDTGTQYRTALFPSSPAQARQARAYIDQLTRARTFPAKIVTTIEPLRTFTAAESYHQDYLVKNPRQPYIVINDQPKVRALARLFPAMIKG